MTIGRLTRQELGWLLAQEARGAAKILRQDVTLLSQPPPVDTVIIGSTPDQRVEVTLNALDDAIGMLSELEAAPGSRPASRRGRIDLAGMLLEFAPTASISIEPGSGTEVFGEEGDLRRMLHVLASQATFAGGAHDSGSPPVRIRREAEFIRITVHLGPDASASADMERRWLSRMATRMGGRVELEGGTLSLLLPADAAAGEVAGLRKELEQAQQLGEAYARELASAFGASQTQEAHAVAEPHDVAQRRFELLVGLATAMYRPLGAILNAHAGEQDGPASSRTASASAGQDFLVELTRVANCSASEEAERLDVSKTIRDAVADADAFVARHGVHFSVELPPELVIRTRPRTLSLLVRTMLDHAVAATPRDGTVTVSLARTPREGNDGPDAGMTFAVTDGGPVVPVAARADLLEHRVDPAALGRPPGIGLLVAHTAAARLGGTLTLGESPFGAAMATATL